jgi:large repetitive protein
MQSSSTPVRALVTFLRLMAVLMLAALPLAGAPSQPAAAAPSAEVVAPLPVAPAPLLDPVPTLTLDVPSTAPIGAEFTFTATFTNTGAPPNEVGYGPFIDLVFPATGVDGIYPGVDPDGIEDWTYDGVTFAGASFMGIPIDDSQIFVQTFPDNGPDFGFPAGTGCVQHPIAVQPNTGIYENDPYPRYYEVCGTAGDQFVTIILPFGSFVPDQPPATVTITAQMSELADLDEPLTISGQAGFQFGYTPLNDFCCNPFDATIPVVSGGIYDATAFPGQTVAPTLMTLSKAYIGPENETATGPNFPRQYVITVDIADGQPVSGLTITDFLPDNIQYVSLDSVTVGGSPAAHTILSQPSTTTPGGTLIVELDDPVVGGNTVEVTFTFYVDRLDASSAVVLDPVTGAFVDSDNTARADGTWETPLDPRDYDPLDLPATSAVCPSPCVVISDQSLAIQKGVANLTDSENNPGDVLEYTLQFQVSDFFGFRELVISDIFTDGQRFDASFTPVLTINGNGYSLGALGMTKANYDVTCDYRTGTFPGDDGAECDNQLSMPDETDLPVSGETALTFRISDEIITRGQNGQLLGGCVDPTDANNPPDCSAYDNGPTTGTLTFRTVIQDQFSDLHLASGNSGDASVDHGDVLDNTVSLSGAVLNIAVAPAGGLFSAQPGDPSPSDGSGAGVSIAFGELQKRIYAINGSTTIPDFLAPGDVVTYRLTYTQPSSDFEETTFTDYLPLPVFDATELDTLNNTICGIPVAGVICLGPEDDYHNLNDSARPEEYEPVPPGNPVVTPTFVTDGPANRLTITYPEYDSIYNISSTIDLLFSVTVTEDPFADGLFLTNQATSSEGTTNAGDQFLDEIVQIRLGQPVLRIGKTAVSTDHVPDTDIIFTPDQTIYDDFELPGLAIAPFTPTIASNDLSTDPNDPDAAFDLFNGLMEGVDNDDLIKYAIIIENKGNSPDGAYDIAIQDILPPGMAIPPGGLNLQIYNGAGDAFGFEVVDFGTDGEYGTTDDIVTTGDATNAFRIFDTGYAIRVVDPSGVDVPGACQVHDLVSGANIIVITYDLLLDDAEAAGTSIINTASIIGYSGTEGGPNHLQVPEEDEAEVITNRLPGLTKTLVETEFDGTGNNLDDQAVIGEIVTYEVEVKFFELETPDAVLVDTLDPGLAFVDLVSVVNSDPEALDIPTMTFDSVTGECDITDVADGCFAGTNSTIHNPVISNNGGTITFDFGNVVNNTDTNNLVAETITITYRAVVLNVIGNQQGTQLNNSANLTWTNATDPVEGSQTVSAENVTVVEPDVTIEKDVNDLLTYDAGDPITYTFVITGGVTIAYDLTFSDPLPEYFIPDDMGSGGDFTVVSDPLGVATNADFEVVGSPGAYIFQTTALADIDLGPGETIDITINGTISIATPANATLENTAIIDWTSLDGDITDRSDYNLDDSNERTGVDGEPGPGVLDDYHRETTIVTTVTNPLVLTKSIVATSEAHTSDTDVAIGEIVRFRLVVEVPEGTNIDLVFEDDLPRGLTFLDDGSARIAFVCTDTLGDCMTSSNVDLGAGPVVAGDETTIDTITPAFVVPGSVISTVRSMPMPGTFATGDTVYFRLDTVVNSDNDPNSEYVVIEFNALVDNEYDASFGSNDDGDTLENFFIAFVGNDQSGDPSDPVSVTVREPEIDIAKTLTAPAPTSFDAGDTVSFTVTYENIGSTDAFDIVLTDDISALPLTNLSVVSVTADAVSCVSPGTIDSSASTASNLLVTVAHMSAGCEVTVVYTADIEYSVNPLEIITNTAEVIYTSLPGDGTTGNPTGSDTPGGSGDEDGERNGTAANPPNDYINDDFNNLTIDDIDPVKSIIRTSEAHTSDTTLDTAGDPRPLAIGEIVTYRLAVQIPEGTSSNFTITDVLPTGFTFIDGTLKLGYLSDSNITNLDATANTDLTPANTYASVAVSPTFDLPAAYYTYTGATRELVIALESPVNNDSDADAEYIVVEFNVLVNNTADNNNTDLKNNNFTVQVDGNDTTSNTVVARIDEPNILFNSTANNKTASPTSGQDAWNIITYTVTYTNTGAATAFEAQVLDTLNATYFVLDVASVDVDVSDLDCAAPIVADNSAGNTVDVTVGSVPVNCTVVITYEAELTISVVPNQSYINTANLTYTSLPGDNGTGGVTPGTPGSDTGERTGDGGVNDYNGSDTASVSIANVAVQKSLVATSESHTSGANVAIGEIARFRLVMRVPESTITNLQFRDFLPNGLTFLNDGSARFAYVANGDLTASDYGISTNAFYVPAANCPNTTGDFTLAQVADPAILASSAIDCVFPNTNNISSSQTSNNDTYATGTDVSFKFGTIVNADDDGNAEFIVVEFNALVDNSIAGSNDSGDTRNNNFRGRSGATPSNLGSTSNNVTLTIREPLIEDLVKSVTSSGPYEAGSTVSYQLTYSNTGNTDAFDVQILDILDATYFNLTLASVSTDVSNAQCAAVLPTVTDDSTGNTVDVTVSRVPVDCDVVITYSATLTTAVNPGVAYDNTADLTYTSLPGENGTGDVTPGTPGATNGERDGSDTPAHNDYNDTHDAQITVRPIEPVKSIVATSESHTSEAGDGSE